MSPLASELHGRQPGTAYAVFSLGLAPSVHARDRSGRGRGTPERAGAAAEISEMSAELGEALGIALLGSLLTYSYCGAVAGALGA